MVLPAAWTKYPAIAWVESRWVRLVVFTFALLFCTTTYYGWQHFKLLMIRDRFLVEVCEVAPAIGEACEEQTRIYDTGYTIGSSLEFAGALLAGIMFDHLGPFWTAVTGLVLYFVSWFIMFTGNSAMWYLGMAMSGLSVNLTAFPALILVDIFPRQQFIMTSVVLAAQVTAAAIMPILYNIALRLDASMVSTIWFFIGVIAAPFAVLYLLSLPINRKHLRMEYERRGLPLPEEHSKPSGKVFFTCLVQQETFLFAIWYVLMILQYNYYFTQYYEIAGQQQADVLGWLFLMQGPMAIFFGWVNDQVLTVPISAVLTIMMSISFALLGKDSNSVSGYVSGILAVLSNAHVYTTKYNYAAELYPREHFGKISGIFGLYAGCLQFLNLLSDASDLPFAQKEIIYGFLSAPQYIILVYLGWRQFAAGRHYRYISMSESERERALLLDYERRINRIHRSFGRPTVDMIGRDKSDVESTSGYTYNSSTSVA